MGWQKIQQEATAALETDAGKALEGQNVMTTLNVPEGAAVNAAKVSISVTGKADGYVDCLQLEEGLSAGRYNLIEGGDFDEGLLMFEKTEMNIYDRVIDSTEPDTTLQYVFRRGVVSDTEVNLRSGNEPYDCVKCKKRGTCNGYRTGGGFQWGHLVSDLSDQGQEIVYRLYDLAVY